MRSLVFREVRHRQHTPTMSGVPLNAPRRAQCVEECVNVAVVVVGQHARFDALGFVLQAPLAVGQRPEADEQ